MSYRKINLLGSDILCRMVTQKTTGIKFQAISTRKLSDPEIYTVQEFLGYSPKGYGGPHRVHYIENNMLKTYEYHWEAYGSD